MKSPLVVHIDYGSAGTAGLYIEKLLLATERDTRVEAYVHRDFDSYSGTARIHRVFGRLSVKSFGRLVGNACKLIELHVLFAFIAAVIWVRSFRYRVIVVVSLFQSFRAYESLFRRLSHHAKLYVIVHDAVEFSHSYPSAIMAPRDEILSHADCLLVHSQDSAKALGYLGKRLVVIPFPPMRPDLQVVSERSDQESRRFLFIGHIRPEKGLNVLLEAWRSLPKYVTNRATLSVAGAVTDGTVYDVSRLENANVSFGFVDDNDFSRLIGDADFLVFPYLQGTNSGVYSIASSLGKPSLTTRIPLFLESPYFIEELSFSSKEELAELITELVGDYDRGAKCVAIAKARATAAYSCFFEYFQDRSFTTL